MAVGNRGFTPGYGTWFKDGKLIQATASSVLVLRPWGKQAMAAEKRAGCGWRTVQPHTIRFDLMKKRVSQHVGSQDSGNVEAGSGQMLLPLCDFQNWLLRRKIDAFRSFLAEIPAPVLAMSTKFRHSQWQIKELLNRVDGGDGGRGPAADLYQARQYFLMFIIANNFAFQRHCPPVRMARKLITLSRDKASEMLGFKAEGICMKRLLQKIPASSIDLRFAHSLRKLLRVGDRSTCKWLAHLPRLNQGALLLLLPWLGLRSHITWHFLTEIARDTREDLRPRLPWLLRSALGRLQSLNPKQAPKMKINSTDDLKAECGEHPWPSSAEDYPPANLQYPDLWCPSGSALVRIMPMETSEQLVALAQDQRNCVATYGPRIARGECYIYRVENDKETCTLSIVDQNGKWIIGDLKGRWNFYPSDETLYWVLSWLALNQSRGRVKFSDFYPDGIPI